MTTDYGVIVAGARVAGATTALHLQGPAAACGTRGET